MTSKNLVLQPPDVTRATYVSYAIACVQDNKILFIRRTGTYPYTSLFGYNVDKLDMDLYFFDRMTEREKLTLLDPTFDFTSFYNELYSGKLSDMRDAARSPEALARAEERISQMRQRALTHFKSIIDRKKHLIRDSLANGFHGSFPYSLPKGRRSSKGGESAIQTALREFCEETGIERNIVRILSRNSFDIRYTDDEDEYLFKIFFATVPSGTRGNINQNDNEQKTEVSEIVWLSKEEFAARNPDALCRRVYLDNFDRLLAEYRRALDGQKHGTELVLADPPSNPRQRRHRYYIEPVNHLGFGCGQPWQRFPVYL